MKTFIKWTGNKSRYFKHILPHIPKNYDVYIEPFIGSGALFLRIAPKKWVINDLNMDLINVWNNVKDHSLQIIDTFKEFGVIFKHLTKEHKIQYCKELTFLIDTLDYDVVRCSIFMLMKFCSYMGVIVRNNKFNFKGLDMHIYIQDKYFFLSENSYQNIINCNTYLNDTDGQIFNKDYKLILNQAKQGDFVFLDPPYVEDHDYQFNYNKDEVIDERFLQELFREVKKLDAKGVRWLMTQPETQQVRDLFKDYTMITFPVYRTITKKTKNEIILKNYR
jgi:DNA adenine methylase